MYSPQVNAVFIYPALLLPPYMPENVSAACEYAAFVSIGHEFTHGFDNNARFAYFPKQDVHSPARHRVEGVVMNTDLWYELYGVDRNYILYLVKSYNHLLCQKRFTLSQS